MLKLTARMRGDLAKTRPATFHCNAIGPACPNEPKVVLVTATDGRMFRDRMCETHGLNYFNRMIAGDDSVYRIEQIEGYA